MIIGLDLDNTIVCYDRLFYDAAVEQSLIPTSTAPSKTAVRDFLRNAGREDDWTRLQGIVYGAEMHRATAFDGFGDFTRLAVDAGHRICVISHRTSAPYLGPTYDLHAAARRWIANCRAAIEAEDVFLEETREAKLQRIQAQKCDVFVDDLPELLAAPNFPSSPRRVWFNPNELAHEAKLEAVASWSELGRLLGLARID